MSMAQQTEIPCIHSGFDNLKNTSLQFVLRRCSNNVKTDGSPQTRHRRRTRLEPVVSMSQSNYDCMDPLNNKKIYMNHL